MIMMYVWHYYHLSWSALRRPGGMMDWGWSFLWVRGMVLGVFIVGLQ